MNSEELLALVKKRRSVFPAQYAKGDVTREELAQVFEAANWAPTHKKTEPWRFVVIEGPAKDRFREFMKRVYVQSTPPEQLSDRKINAMMEKCDKSDKIVLINLLDTYKVPEWEELAATAMAVQNMWLMCTALNIGGYWSSPLNIISNMDEFTPMEEGEKCVGIFYMGKLDTPLMEGVRKPVQEKIRYIDL